MHTTLTPLFDAIEGLRRQDFSRFHTPGHKGAPLGFLSAVTPWDFTEVRGADSLFEAEGPIAETERLYTELYGTAGSFLSAGGSTLCIQAMLRLVQPLGQKILIGRNAHGSAVSAMALLGLEPVWLCPGTGADLLPVPITPAQAEEALTAVDEDAEAEACRQAAEKLASRYSREASRQGMQKLTQALVRRGFGWEDARRAAEQALQADE